MSGWHRRRSSMLNNIGRARTRTFFKFTNYLIIDGGVNVFQVTNYLNMDGGVNFIAFVSAAFFGLKNVSN